MQYGNKRETALVDNVKSANNANMASPSNEFFFRRDGNEHDILQVQRVIIYEHILREPKQVHSFSHHKKTRVSKIVKKILKSSSRVGDGAKPISHGRL